MRLRRILLGNSDVLLDSNLRYKHHFVMRGMNRSVSLLVPETLAISIHTTKLLPTSILWDRNPLDGVRLFHRFSLGFGGPAKAARSLAHPTPLSGFLSFLQHRLPSLHFDVMTLQVKLLVSETLMCENVLSKGLAF